MGQALITRQTTSGHTIELGLTDSHEVYARIDGRLGPVGTPVVIPDAARHKIPADYSHLVGQVAILATEMPILMAAREAAIAADPAAVLRRLRGQRDAIVLRRRLLLDEAEDGIADAHQRGSDQGAAYARAATLREQAAAVSAELAAFDAEYPQVRTAMRAEEAALARRAEWM